MANTCSRPTVSERAGLSFELLQFFVFRGGGVSVWVCLAAMHRGDHRAFVEQGRTSYCTGMQMGAVCPQLPTSATPSGPAGVC